MAYSQRLQQGGRGGAAAAAMPDFDDYLERESSRRDAPSANDQASGGVPDVVKTFVSYLYRHIREKNVFEIHQMYDSSFRQLSARFFPQGPWPDVDLIAPVVEQDHVFCLLYRELYYRDVFARLQPTLQQRCESWENYCSLFQVVLHGSLNMQLPNQWLWDMVDEFVYQFQSWCQYRSKLKSRTEEELVLLQQCGQVWNVLGVCNYLQALIDKSAIVYTLLDDGDGGAAQQFTQTEGYDVGGEGGGSNVLRTLGYFSIVGLLRVHCLLGDYHTALQRLAPIDLGRPGLFQRVIGCHVAVMYHYGFASMRMRRYVDAIKAFNQMLLVVIKTKAYHEQQSPTQFDMLMKKNEQLYALLAVCLALCPNGKLVEEKVNAQLQEKNGERILRMQRGEEAIFDELFSFACPKFITPSPPPPDPSQPLANYNQSAYRVQLRLFLADVRAHLQLPGLRPALALYSTISVARLASFLDTSELALRTALVTFTHKNYVTEYDGTVTSNTDLHFYIDDDVVRVVEHKPKRHFGEYFIRHITRLDEMVAELDAVKLE